MGEAKRRGTRDERVAAATPKAAKPAPEYKYKLPYRNSALDFLWGHFKVGPSEETINELRARAVAEQKAAQKTAEERNAARILEVSAAQQEAEGALQAE